MAKNHTPKDDSDTIDLGKLELVTLFPQKELALILKLLDDLEEPILPYTDDVEEMRARVLDARKRILREIRHRIDNPRPPDRISK